LPFVCGNEDGSAEAIRPRAAERRRDRPRRRRRDASRRRARSTPTRRGREAMGANGKARGRLTSSPYDKFAAQQGG
jgi:hypothetical protein